MEDDDVYSDFDIEFDYDEYFYGVYKEEEEEDEEQEEQEEDFTIKILIKELKAGEEDSGAWNNLQRMNHTNNTIISNIKPKILEIKRIDQEYSNEYIIEKLEINEEDLPKNCTDIIMSDTYEINNYLKETPDTFMFVNAGIPGKYDVLCFTKEYLINIVHNYNNWIYKCIGKKPDIKAGEITYIKLPINQHGFNGLIERYKLLKIIDSKKRVFYIVPKLNRLKEQITFISTISFINGKTEYRNYVSANHCQEGSNFLIYDIKECSGEKCMITNLE